MEKTFETPGDVRLYVENEVGHVGISTGVTETTQISLEPETPGAEELIARATVECRTAGDRHIVVVKVPRQGMRFLRRNGVSVRVELPQYSDVNVMAGSAEVDINGPVGTAEVATSSGDISTDDVAGDFQSKTATGDIIVGSVRGDLKVHTASGDLRCSSVAGRAVFATASGDLEVGAAGNQVDVKATSGDVRLGELAHGARVQNVSGDVRVLALAEGTLHVRSVSGSVSVGIAKDVDLHVDVETTSGEVRSDIPLGDSPGAARAAARVDVSVRSVSGDVEIERALELVA
jgi:DUF4097 and DUF4098 domain-containing protein YvlB